MKSFVAKPGSVEQKWFVIDADGQILGRMASQVASILRGKNKPEFTPHADTGDYVIIVNAAKVQLTGKKLDQKFLYRHSGYVGGLKEVSYRRLMEKNPEKVVFEAVQGMLPKSPLGRNMIKKLKVYAGSEHDHAAQKPETLSLD